MRPYLKKTHHKKRAGGVAQVERLPSKCEAKFKPQYHQKKKKKRLSLKKQIIINAGKDMRRKGAFIYSWWECKLVKPLYK
jgi:hypothetical protein